MSNLNHLDCSICWQRYDESERVPRILTYCGHTFCESCISSSIESETSIARCSICRAITNLPNGNTNDLKKNFVALNGIQRENALISIQESSEYENERALGIHCGDNEDHIAVVYCTHCKANYCYPCSKTSHDSTTLSSHQFVKLTEKPEPPLFCPIHEFKIAERFCQYKSCEIENKVMCDYCYLYEPHKDHKYEEIDKDIFFEDDKNKTIDSLKELSIEIERIRQEPIIDPVPVENDENVIISRHEINRIYNIHLEMLNNYKQSITDSLEERANQDFEAKKKENDECRKKLKDLESIEKMCSDLTKRGKNEYFGKMNEIIEMRKEVDNLKHREDSNKKNMGIVERLSKTEKVRKDLEMDMIQKGVENGIEIEKSLPIDASIICESIILENQKEAGKIVFMQDDWRPITETKEEILKKWGGIEISKYMLCLRKNEFQKPVFVNFWNTIQLASAQKMSLKNTTFVFLAQEKARTFLEKTFKKLPNTNSVVYKDLSKDLIFEEDFWWDHKSWLQKYETREESSSIQEREEHKTKLEFKISIEPLVLCESIIFETQATARKIVFIRDCMDAEIMEQTRKYVLESLHGVEIIKNTFCNGNFRKWDERHRVKAFVFLGMLYELYDQTNRFLDKNFSRMSKTNKILYGLNLDDLTEWNDFRRFQQLLKDVNIPIYAGEQTDIKFKHGVFGREFENNQLFRKLNLELD